MLTPWLQHVVGSPMHIWETKLKKVRMALKDWAKLNYREPEKVRNEIKGKVEAVQTDIDIHGVSQEKHE